MSDHEILVGSADAKVRRYDLRNGHLMTGKEFHVCSLHIVIFVTILRSLDIWTNFYLRPNLIKNLGTYLGAY